MVTELHTQIRALHEEVSNLRENRQRPHSGRKKDTIRGQGNSDSAI